MIRVRRSASEPVEELDVEEFERRARAGEVAPQHEVCFPAVTGEEFIGGEPSAFSMNFPPSSRLKMSSDTRPPSSMIFFAATPRSLPALTCARSMSPVEIWGMPYFSLMTLAWVPLPAPGPPNRIKRIYPPPFPQ